MKRKEKKVQVVSIRITAEQLQTVQDLAKSQDRPISYVIRELIARGLQT